MAQVLITSGPTQEPIDPVRYLSNRSSGRMGAALAAAAVRHGHEVVVVSGPVSVPYPPGIQVISVVTTEEMLEAVTEQMLTADWLIAAAAPCDFRPAAISSSKLKKQGRPIELRLVETPDILARVARSKGSRRIVGFALETDRGHTHAREKLKTKNCDLIVLNGPAAMQATESSVEVLDATGAIVLTASGPKEIIADQLIQLFGSKFESRG